MTGRDPEEPGRVSSPLELLFDLTFVVAVGTAASQFAGLLVLGRLGAGTAAFVMAMFAISVAWINCSWFALAFATDDWLFRVLTMLQMVGVVIFSLGLPALFRSVDQGGHLQLRGMVIGYVVMRLAMIAQWWRVARESARFRRGRHGEHPVDRSCPGRLGSARVRPYAGHGRDRRLPGSRRAGTGAGAAEPGRRERDALAPAHVAERYSLFAIITLGEAVVGTVASSSGLLGGADRTHWTGDAVAVVVAGVGLTFGMWWVYFTTPFGEVLSHRRRRGYLFGYGHIPLLMGIAAAGAGLHVAGLFLEEHTRIGEVTVVLALAILVALYLLMVYLLHTLLLSTADPFHLLLIVGTFAVLAVSVLLSVAGVPLAVCLLVIMLAPFVTVLGYETVGHRHQERMLADLEAVSGVE